mgnify:CR=1 FL=1
MSQPNDPEFAHTFLPAPPGVPHPVTLLLLPGTGGDENDLVPLGRDLRPDAALLGVRGQVSEGGLSRFFRRFAEGVFDVEDLKSRTGDLARFVRAASERYRFSRRRLIALGYSNGANMAASLMLLHPQALGAGLLFRAMVPFVPDTARDFSHLSVFLAAGDRDPMVPPEQPEALATMFARGGADVTLRWLRGGHALGREDIEAARAWLADTVGKRAA